MRRNKVDDGERARILFDEFCLWRRRVNEGYRHVSCDENSNRIMKRLREIGYYVIYSDAPKQDGYNYAITKLSISPVPISQVLLTDIDLGFNLYDDLVLNDLVKTAGGLVLSLCGDGGDAFGEDIQDTRLPTGLSRG